MPFRRDSQLLRRDKTRGIWKPRVGKPNAVSGKRQDVAGFRMFVEAPGKAVHLGSICSHSSHKVPWSPSES